MGMDTGYGRKRQWLSLLVDDIVEGGVVLSCSGSVGDDGVCTGGSVVPSVDVAVLGWKPMGGTGDGVRGWRRFGKAWRSWRN